MFFKKDKFSPTYDFLVVGLGNKGKEYDGTRHNIGFCVIDALCDDLKAECKKSKFKSLIGDGKVGDKRILIMKPQTYMNLSGQAVTEAMNFYKLKPEQVIVVFDDISLDVGRLRIRAKGSDGGHRGMRNIIELTGKDVFPRIKIGVEQKPNPDYDTKDWVLGKFKREDAPILNDSVKGAVGAIKAIVTEDISTAMNKFNK